MREGMLASVALIAARRLSLAASSTGGNEQTSQAHSKPNRSRRSALRSSLDLSRNV